MATDDNGKEESTIEDILHLGRNRAKDKVDDLLEETQEILGQAKARTEECLERVGEFKEGLEPYVAEGMERAGELSERTQEGYTNMLECAKAEQHLWYQMWTTGTGMFTDSAKGLLGSKPSELKSESTVGYVGGILGGTFISVLSLPALIIEETVRYAARKIAERK